MRFDRILFPVDLSEQCRRAAPFVKAVALRYDAEVLMLHVMEIPPSVYSPPPDLTFAVLPKIDQWRQERRAVLETFLREELAGISVVRAMVEGDAALTIVNHAKSERIDLIMMPTHGYGPFRALLLGSVTAKVLHDAECPVWTMVHTEKKMADPPDRWRRILCAVDITDEEVLTVAWAKDLADTEGAKLLVLHALEESDPAIEEVQRKMLEMFGAAITEREISVEPGTPARVVRKIAREWPADLVVIGRGKVDKALGRLRSQAYAIIRESPSPVISVSHPRTDAQS
jgi:nucleotide-binding universal stress UspA family protein